MGTVRANGTVHAAGDGCFAYVQRDGSWGWSNAGLIVGEGRSLLVDTLFDLRLTAEMLDAFGPASAGAPIGVVVNTHANGDHCYGNQLVAGAEIIASSAAAAEMAEVPPSLLAGLNQAPGDVGDLFRSFFGEFRFDDIELTLPTRTFDGRLTLEVGGREVELIEVGPAHTAGDTLVHVPAARTIFTGDILFIGGTPVVWAGPIANWIAACDTMLALDASTVVPGHGPITDADGIRAVRGYLEHITEQADAAYRGGLSFQEAADAIDLGPYANWLDAERVVVNVYQRYRELGAEMPEVPVTALLVLQAEWHAKRGGGR
jgi:glyoxylase-like metal-dependent hydrolase (beta-lactamase superfamily II)